MNSRLLPNGTGIRRLKMTDYKVLLLWVVWCCEVVITGCEVVWVNRNVTDSFRVGEDGCTNDSNVCTSLSATCQPDGSCLCKTGSPTFRNPVIERSGLLMYGSTYGCIENVLIPIGVSTVFCHLKPFQVIPYSHSDSVTTFIHNDPAIQLQSCSVRNILVKFPDNATEMELQWLNESYVDISVSNNDLYFKWKRSVPDLQGTIITFSLNCFFGASSQFTKCLRAKVRGAWPTETASTTTEPTVTSTKIKSSAKTLNTPFSSQKSTRSRTVIPESTVYVGSDDESFADTTLPVARPTTVIPESTVYVGSEDKSCADTTSKVFIALFSISVVVNVVLGIIVAYLWKDRKRIQDKKVREMGDIGEKGTGNLGETSIYDEVVDSGRRNNGMKEDSFPSTGQKNSNERLSDHEYEEALNYEPLRRNLPQDENEEHNYQSLTTSQKTE